MAHSEIQRDQATESKVIERKSYESPALTPLGDVRDLTLGGSPGTGDSGDPGTQQF